MSIPATPTNSITYVSHMPKCIQCHSTDLRFAGYWFAGYLFLVAVNWLSVLLPRFLRSDSNDGEAASVASFGEVTTGFVVGVAVVFHFVLEPWWLRYRSQQKRKQRKAEGDTKADCDISIDMETLEESGLTSEEEEASDSDGEATAAAATTTTTVTSVPTKQPKPKQERLYFLDNIKIFLTFVVTTYHITKAFGADHEYSSYLVLGLDNQETAAVVIRGIFRAFATICQGFFMPLFFFISGYFVPRSYDKCRVIAASASAAAGDHDTPPATSSLLFVQSKSHRLFWPAALTSLTIVPACQLIQSSYRNSWEEILFVAAPAHTWYLFWLLLFCWMYESWRKAHHAANSTTTTTGGNNDDEECQQQEILPTTTTTATKDTEQATRPIPNAFTRRLWGAGVCGIVQFVIVLSFGGTFLVGFMPLYYGSGVIDLLFFVVGMMAYQNKWLQTTTTTTTSTSTSYSGLATTALNTRVWGFRFIVFLEGIVMVALTFGFHEWYKAQNNGGLQDLETLLGVVALPLSPFGLPFYVVAGIFCVDMGLAVVQICQQYFNRPPGKFGRFCSKAAYTVYLIHPLLIVSSQVIYIYLYNCFVSDPDNEVYFVPFDETDKTTRGGQGGGPYMALAGWIFSNLVTHLIGWPLAYWISNLPYLKTML